jgi:hypothetical protein
MPSSGIIDLAIGLAFVFGVTAALSSVATELIARLLGLRGAYLLLGLRELVDSNETAVNLGDALTDFGNLRTLIKNAPLPPPKADAEAPPPKADAVAPPPKADAVAPPPKADAAAPPPEADAADPKSATGALLGSPILRSQGITGQIVTRQLTLNKAGDNKNNQSSLPKGTGKNTWSMRRSLPSYIPARSFAEAVIDLVVPDTAGQTTMDTVQHYIGQLPDSMSTLRTSLQALARSADDDITHFRTSVENWYDDHMDRVSGWYKRHVAKITIAVGAILVLLLNINTITIGRALYSNSVIRSAVSTVAAKSVACPAGQGQQACLANLQTQLAAAAQAGLPIGWGTVSDCAAPDAHCSWLEQRGILSPHGSPGWQLILVLIGFLITITALTPGAQFWFGLLAKLGSLRSSGPPPAPPAS